MSPITPALLAVLAATVLVSGREPQGSHEPRDPDPLMMSLAENFAGAEKRLAARDLAAFAESVETIREQSRGIPGLREREDDGTDGGFREYATGFRELAESVSRHARGGDAARTSAAFEDLRNACVQCHATYRRDNATRGMYPARWNTVTGSVSVFMLGGKEREDRSNVVVFLEGVSTPPDRIAHWQTRRITQKDARFEPRVLPIVQGEVVEFPNDDFIFHNVFSLSETLPFDLGAYGPGKSRSVEFPRTGLVRIYCNIHPQMLSTVLVLGNPCFSTTDARGRFTIAGVPDGTYVLRTWHEYGGEHRESVPLSGGQLATVPIRISEDKVTVEHRNKFGLPYREAYK